jgi:DhnA family fructose-bisphosphate aldolase class Ia
LKQYRLNRLFNAESGRCIDIALDHGVFGEAEFISGIEDLPAMVNAMAAARPDALQLTIGQASLLQSKPGRDKPALVLRTDLANVYGRRLPDRLFSAMVEDAAMAAVRLDAACVVVNLLDIPGRAEVHEACIRNVLSLRAACEQVGMPMMVEPLVMRPNEELGGYMSEGDTAKVIGLVRQAVELGADVIKADPTDSLDDYHLVIQAARVPLLVRGGGRVGDQELLTRTQEVLAQGAAGIVYGRNVVQHPNPVGILNSLQAVVHRRAQASEALASLR